MNKSRIFTNVKKVNWYQTIVNRRCQSQSIGVVEKQHFPRPIIPVRIKRGPTDILKALATTVGRDPTAPLYKFHDDPYLYPFSYLEKKKYALSKESGRKAAKWVRDKHPNLFNHHPDDPIIKDFIPKITFTDESEVSESDLLYCINNVLVSDAINVYKLCKTKNIELSSDVHQSLLELVSFYNCEDKLDEEWIEENMWELVETFNKVKTWKDGSFAEELFNDLKELGAKPYCAIIRGMSLHRQNKRAWELYQEALQKDLTLDTETFNSIIRVASHMERENELKWALMKETLAKMINFKIPPNLGTLNAILEGLAVARNWRETETLGLQIFSAFRKLNIEPSLATYHYLLKIFYKYKSNSDLLPSLLDIIENKEFDIRDIDDTNFFSTAMDISVKNLKSFHTATRVYNLLIHGDNLKLLGGYSKELWFKRHYFMMALNSLALEEFMKLYDDWVPHYFSPGREDMMELINVINTFGDLKLLPRVWSDCILLEVHKFEELITLTLDVINQNELQNVDEQLATQLVNIVWDMWNTMLSQRNKSNYRKWSASAFGDCLSIVCQCNDVKKSMHLFSAIIDNPDIIIGVILVTSLKKYFDVIVSEGLYNESLIVLQYCKDQGYQEGTQWAEHLSNQETTPQNIKSKLDAMFSLTKL